ncbi:MAG: PrgI family protein [Candidatus Gracilibacteria bacterium]|jgi:hypothetical protein
MQFKIPQDVQREDTIIGPLTLKQMAILGIGGGITYAIYISLAKAYFIEVWIAPVVITGTLTLAFAFLKIADQKFHIFLINFIQYKMLPRKRVWIQMSGVPFVSPETQVKTTKKIAETKKEPDKDIEKLTKILDTYGKTQR